MRQARLFCPIKWAIDKPEPRNYIQNYKQPIEKSNFNITVNDHAGSRLVRSTVISKSRSRPQGRRFPSHRPGTVNCRLQSICSTPACVSRLVPLLSPVLVCLHHNVNRHSLGYPLLAAFLVILFAHLSIRLLSRPLLPSLFSLFFLFLPPTADFRD